MSLLHHHHHHVPFEDIPDPVEADLRGQIGRLHDERRDFLRLVEEQRIELARAERENHELRRKVSFLERQLAKRPRWWPR